MINMLKRFRSTLVPVGLGAIILSSLLMTATASRADPNPVNLRDLSGTPSLSQSNKPTTVGLYGTSYKHAILVSSPGSKAWQIDYNLNGKYSSFSAQAGVGDKLGPTVTAVFSLVGDGKVIQSSDPMHSGDEPYDFDAVDVSSVQKLSLIVKSSSGFPRVIVWDDPQLVPSSNAAANSDQSPGNDQGLPQPSPSSSGPVSLAVVPFGAPSDDTAQAAATVTSMVAKQIGTDLANIDVVPSTEVAQEVSGTTGYLSHDDLLQAGQALGAKYIITGAISNAKEDQNSGIFGITKTTVTLDFDGKIQDATTGQLLGRASVEGKADGSSVNLGGQNVGDADDKIFQKAASKAVQDFCTKIEAFLKPALGASSK